MYNPFSLSNKIILVTGASSGIGRAIAIECSKMGATLIISGRNVQRLEETFSLLNGKDHAKCVVDLSDDNDLASLIDVLPTLDGIVHCAGLTKTVPIQFISKASMDSVMRINFEVPSLLSAALIKKKKIAKNGSIVFISSINGVECGSLASSLYSASKGAINGLMKSMALDLAPKKIRVNSVNPGMVETRIFDEGIINQDQLNDDRNNYPLKRYGQPEEIAYSVIYLLSDASSWVTGSKLVIDGGFTLK